MIAKKKYEFIPDYAVPPGETLREVMESLDMNQKELAARTELTVQTINRIFKGEQPISYETANRLELSTNVPARIWNNLEAKYREQIFKLEERIRLEDDLDWMKSIPISVLKKRGYIQEKNDRVLILREVLSFYGVSSVQAWHDIWEKPAIAARRSPCFETRPGPASAWIRQGQLKAKEIECMPFDKTLFHGCLHKIRTLTRKGPDVFVPEVIKLCAETGVAIALVPEMAGVPWNGATQWLKHNKAMILLSLRGKGEDKFWFSFFHEAGHVLNDNKKDLLINDGSQDDPREVRANRFASQFLIPENLNAEICGFTNRNQIIEMADKLGISTGIVAGRFQFLTKKWDYFKNLIRTFQWSTN